MKQFVIGGLNTPQKKSEAEAILKGLGYVDRVEWNSEHREYYFCTFIDACRNGDYQYHNHDCDQPPITLDELRTMKKQER